MNNKLNDFEINENFIEFGNKTKKILLLLKKEYDIIIKFYEPSKIFKKSLPIRVSKIANKKQKNEINKYINNIFIPTFKVISPMIDNGIIEWETASEEVYLDKNDKELINNLVYESWDRLYVYKYINYNIILNFIMQIYVIFEKEFIKTIKSKFDNNFSGKTLFYVIRYIEKHYNIEISPEIKKILNMYRNVINVYKHGYGDSYLDLMKNEKSILNKYIDEENMDTAFIFNLNKISFNEIYNAISNLLDALYKK